MRADAAPRNAQPVRQVSGVSIAGMQGRFDLILSDGRIASVSPATGSGEGGGLVMPLLADAHVHLDKTFTGHRAAGTASSLFEAIDLMARDRAGWTEDDVRRRATMALERASAHGVGVMRSHVDWTEPAVPLAWSVLNELRQEWRGTIELQLASLAPLDLIEVAGEAIAARVARDGGVFGAFVYRNTRLVEKVERMFSLAGRFDLALDFHVDEGLDLEARGLDAIVATAARRPKGRPVLCGHACSLSLRSDDEARAVLDAAASAGVGIVALPTTNSHLQDRKAGRTPRQRGIAPMVEARARGVTTMLASDNCRDVFYPFGDYDPLDVLRSGVLIGHLDPEEWFDAVTTVPAAWCGSHAAAGIAPGAPADFLWFDAENLTDLVSRPRARREIWRRGEMRPRET